ncbi:hypothetical protein BH11PSE10_BH11PSE10_14830 [soil metagenome]
MASMRLRMAVAIVLSTLLLVLLVDGLHLLQSQTAQQAAAQGQLATMLLRDAVLVLALSTVLVTVLDRLLLLPLRRLAASAEAFDPTVPPPLPPEAELQQISQSITRVHESLGRQLEDEQRRAADLRRTLMQTESLLEGKIRELGTMSRVDKLTGLPNRGEFDEALRREFKRAQRHRGALALAVLDLDHFKKFNERHGTAAGDAALRRFANLLAERFKRDTDFVARLGGEEFVALLPASGPAETQGLLEQLRDDWRDLALPDASGVMGEMGEGGRALTVSVGLAVYGPAHPYLSPQALMQAADEALYIAKHAGRDRLSLAASAGPA